MIKVAIIIGSTRPGRKAEAVAQWVYKPTMMNGEAVDVITQVDVSFTLSQ